ncbi:MAG TPA: universal stress protein [Mucilaginibacter sp.]|nr:universal stress protein [Mucilaginibacter sp.]
MKTILILTDFSVRAGYAAEFAMQVAISNKANLLLCHAIESNPHFAYDIDINIPEVDNLDTLKYDSILDLKNVVKRLKKLVSPDEESFKPAINYTTSFGNLADVAKDVIKQQSVDLVVMASHRSDTLSRFLSRNHIHTLLDKIDCPLLLIPECVPFKGISNIGYATDLSFTNNKVVSYLTEMAKPFNASVTVNHICPPLKNVKELPQITEYPLTKYSDIKYSTVFYHHKENNVKTGLMEMARFQKLDILALVHKRYDFFEGLFHSSVSKAMADLAIIPMLVLPYSFTEDMTGISEEQLDQYCYHTGDWR